MITISDISVINAYFQCSFYSLISFSLSSLFRQKRCYAASLRLICLSGSKPSCCSISLLMCVIGTTYKWSRFHVPEAHLLGLGLQCGELFQGHITLYR